MSSTNTKTNITKKESILELTKMIDAKVHVKCLGGREVVGVLKGYDELVNLVLDDADEYLRGKLTTVFQNVCPLHTRKHSNTSANFNKDPEDTSNVTGETRKLGLVVIRGTQVSVVSPEDGMEEIANPFIAVQE